MIVSGSKITCDCCRKVVFCDNNDIDREADKWKFGSEIGDLCPTCANQWQDWKSTFVEKIRKETKGSIV